MTIFFFIFKVLLGNICGRKMDSKLFCIATIFFFSCTGHIELLNFKAVLYLLSYEFMLWKSKETMDVKYTLQILIVKYVWVVIIYLIMQIVFLQEERYHLHSLYESYLLANLSLIPILTLHPSTDTFIYLYFLTDEHKEVLAVNWWSSH